MTWAVFDIRRTAGRFRSAPQPAAAFKAAACWTQSKVGPRWVASYGFQVAPVVPNGHLNLIGVLLGLRDEDVRWDSGRYLGSRKGGKAGLELCHGMGF